MADRFINAGCFISSACKGERCAICDAPAEHKVEEAIPYDDPQPIRHPLTAYVCHRHFTYLMGEQ